MSSNTDYRISVASVANLSDDELFWALIENAWPDEEEPDTLVRCAKATPGQRAILSITLFVREVCNGGLEQFFWNSSGDIGDEVIAGFERLGANDRAAAVRQALAFFGSEARTSDQTFRREKLSEKSRQELEAFFEPLNVQFYDEEKLYPLFRRYLDSHPDEFYYDAASK